MNTYSIAEFRENAERRIVDAIVKELSDTVCAASTDPDLKHEDSRDTLALRVYELSANHYRTLDGMQQRQWRDSVKRAILRALDIPEEISNLNMSECVSFHVAMDAIFTTNFSAPYIALVAQEWAPLGERRMRLEKRVFQQRNEGLLSFSGFRKTLSRGTILLSIDFEWLNSGKDITLLEAGFARWDIQKEELACTHHASTDQWMSVRRFSNDKVHHPTTFQYGEKTVVHADYDAFARGICGEIESAGQSAAERGGKLVIVLWSGTYDQRHVPMLRTFSRTWFVEL
ncbi:unnamed protein product [Peniophora sp. CBMAI 1063]|nr:unnamed protein product [Peniophora sp. CBMAI 1063]